VTGFAAADTLAELGARVMIAADAIDSLRVNMCEVIGVDVAMTSPSDPVPPAVSNFGAEVLVASPGYAPHHPLIRWATERGIAIWGDIELAWRVRDKVRVADWILVTGTNGKTTTTQLTAAMFAEAGHRVAPCGNIGVSVLDAVRDPEGFEVFVVELSSFQLHYASGLEPYAAVCLNIAEDHLDWHGSMDAYIAAKARVYSQTRVACVFNRADSRTLAMVEQAEVVEGARAIGIGVDTPGLSDLGIVDGILCDRAFLDDRRDRALELTTIDELREHGLASPHIVVDILAAAALARSYGVSPESISAALSTFTMDKHRYETVASIGGVTWIDDSKATNPHAADASLRANESVVWIVGGLLKGVEIDALVERHAARLRGAVIIGRERDVIREAFGRHAPELHVVDIDSDDTSEVMTLAVRTANAMAVEGDVVLLAPAAASMDQFADYAERGRLFREAVLSQMGGEADDESASRQS
jgi:UDP-N-acetylmuramoylalanine--D-glutamate ligase